MDMVFYFLPAILFLGAITSYEDIKFGKIRNKWIILGVLFGILINVGLVIAFGIEKVEFEYYKLLMSNNLIAFLIGFGFFYYDIWSEGDGKLFFVYTFLIPLTSYANSQIFYLYSFNLLVNIFVPYLLYTTIKLIIKPRKEVFINALIDLFRKDLWLSIIRLFSISWIIKLFFNLFNVNNTIFILTVSMLIYSLLSKLSKGKEKKAILNFAIVISFFRLIADKSVYSYQFWIYFLISVFIYKLIFNSFLKNLIEQSALEYTKTRDIKPGNILAYPIMKDKNRFYLSQNPEKGEDKKNVYLESGFVLEEKDIKKLVKNKKINFKIPVYNKIPFAHLMFLGVLITIILKGNILIFMINLFR